MKRLAQILYGIWCWAAFLPLALGTLALVLVAPGLERRRSIARAGARGFLALAGIPLAVRGLEHLPPGPCVVVANHASYLDGVVMQAALPPRFAFVIKPALVHVPLASLLLRRLGSEFVDRSKRESRAADARRVLKRAANGQAIGFFPEGTFTPAPGLGPFHAGAFVTAARAGLPVVPIALRGTRAILPAEAALPQPGRIEVELLPALAPGTPDEPDRADRLRREARTAILARVGEPDLTEAT
ncbi:MAG: lysophospholipid acyltransferase family protein [Pseudomonadota bacterium]